MIKTIFAWLVILAAILGLSYLWASDDLNELALTQDNLIRKQELLARLESLPNREASIRKQLMDLNNSAASKYLYTGDPSSIQALIQRDIRELAGRVNVQLGSVRSLGLPHVPSTVQRISLQLNLVTSHEQLIDFLAEIEAWEPLLRVQRMSARVQQQSTETDAAQLAIMLEVAGFVEMKKEGL